MRRTEVEEVLDAVRDWLEERRERAAELLLASEHAEVEVDFDVLAGV